VTCCEIVTTRGILFYQNFIDVLLTRAVQFKIVLHVCQCDIIVQVCTQKAVVMGQLFDGSLVTKRLFGTDGAAQLKAHLSNDEL